MSTFALAQNKPAGSLGGLFNRQDWRRERAESGIDVAERLHHSGGNRRRNVAGSQRIGTAAGKPTWRRKDRTMTIAKNTICLWYDKDAEDAARFYAEFFPTAR